MTDHEHLAAEYALGLLEGAELLEARRLLASGPAFAAEVNGWDARLAPLLDELSDVAPSSDLWPRIEAALAEASPEAEIVVLRRRVRRWRLGAGIAAAAAVVLALISLPPRGPNVVPQAPEAPLMASLAIGPAAPRIGVAWLPERRELLVSAAGVPADRAHDRQLWLVPKNGAPRSLGVVRPDAAARVTVAPELAVLLGEGATLAVSQEPPGGSPTGLPTGPVVATATLQKT